MKAPVYRDLLRGPFLLAITAIVEYPHPPEAEDIEAIVFDQGVFYESP